MKSKCEFKDDMLNEGDIIPDEDLITDEKEE